MEVQNGRTRIVVEPRTGSVARIEDTVTGLVHVDAYAHGRTDGRLVRVIATAPEWFSRHADSHEQPPPAISREGGGVCIRYPDLACNGRCLGIAAEARVGPGEAPDEVRFALRLVNHGSAEVNAVFFPWLGGWRGQGGPGKDEMVLGASASLDPHALPRPGGPSYARSRQRMAFPFPVSMYLPWMDLSGPGGGLSLVNYMDQALNGSLILENLAGYGPGLHLAFGWEHPVVIRPGESWEAPPFGIAAHAGDWHETADRYKRWMGANLRPPMTGPDTRRMIGFQNVFFRGFDGTPIRDLSELGAVAAAGRRHGVRHLCVWDELTLGNYARHGARDLTDYSEAEQEAFRRGLQDARAGGTDVCALINFRHPNPVQSLTDGAIGGQIKRCYDGTAQTENWSGSHHHGSLFVKHLGPESYIYSPFAPEYHERVLRLTGEYLALGYNSMFFDQPFEVLPDYGFMDAGHRPEMTHAAALDIIARLRRLIHERDPEALMIGEECDPFASQWIDLWMSWSLSDLGAVKRGARIRYAIPGTMLSWMVDSELDRASAGFALGMPLCLCVHGGEATLEAEPELARHVAAQARLRDRCAQRTAFGEFRDTRGLDVDADEGFLAYGYDSPHGPAVIVAAVGRPASGAVTLDPCAFAGPVSQGAEGVLCRLDGAEEPTGGETHRFTLDKNEVGVWMP